MLDQDRRELAARHLASEFNIGCPVCGPRPENYSHNKADFTDECEQCNSVRKRLKAMPFTFLWRWQSPPPITKDQGRNAIESGIAKLRSVIAEAEDKGTLDSPCIDDCRHWLDRGNFFLSDPSGSRAVKPRPKPPIGDDYDHMT